MPLARKAIEAVVFDLDDTLIDWSRKRHTMGQASRVHLDKVHDYLSAKSHKLPDKDTFFEQYQETIIQGWQKAKKTWKSVSFGNVLSCCFANLELEVEQIDMGAVLRAFDWKPVPGVDVYEDTIPVLKTLHEQGYKIGLVTNSMMPMWMRDIELRAFNLINYFDARITSGDTGHIKPHPAIYERILRMLDTEPERAVFVGDRPANDILGANKVGLITVLMSPPHLEYDLNGVQPDYTITRLRELLSILEELES